MFFQQSSEQRRMSGRKAGLRHHLSACCPRLSPPSGSATKTSCPSRTSASARLHSGQSSQECSRWPRWLAVRPRTFPCSWPSPVCLDSKGVIKLFVFDFLCNYISCRQFEHIYQQFRIILKMTSLASGSFLKRN